MVQDQKKEKENPWGWLNNLWGSKNESLDVGGCYEKDINALFRL